MNTAIDLSFVAKYQYPTLVKEHFERILSHIDASKVESVILTGSTSRGELSYQMTRGALSLYSDYEFLVIAKGRVDECDVERLAKAFEKLEGCFSNNPLFHIDFSYTDAKHLGNLPPCLKHYETRKNGKTIYGQNMLALLPEITVENLDFKDLNEILIWRLWALLLYLPREFIRFSWLSSESENLYKYVLCRNALDLTTWILPSKGVLVDGFRKRNAYLQSNFHELQDNRLIDGSFLDLMNECVTGKFELKFRHSLVDLYTTVIEYFVRAKKYLLNVDYTADDNGNWGSCDIEKNSWKFFHDCHHRRKGYEVLFFLKNFQSMGIRRGLRWILAGKYGLMLEFLCNIHLALALNLSGDKKQGFRHLHRAHSMLQELNVRGVLKTEHRDFSELWLALRRGFANFLMDYFPSVQAKKAYINSIIQ